MIDLVIFYSLFFFYYVVSMLEQNTAALNDFNSVSFEYFELNLI